MPDVVYKDETHQYFVDGVEFPSVSTVLNYFVSFDRVPPAVLERKRLIGRAVHSCIELHAKDELDMDSVDPAVQPYFQSWLKLIETKPLRVVQAETIIYSKVHRYAGRFDFVLEFDDDPDWWMTDAKSCDRMPASTALQTAAYAQGFLENTGVKITKRAGIQLQPDGSCAKFFPYTKPENRNDLLYFLNFKNGLTWIRNHERTH